MMTQTISTQMHSKMPLLVVAALVALSLSLFAAPRPASASTTFPVNQMTDVADENLADNVCDINSGVPGNQCTLRAAIQEANDTPGSDTIDFNLFGGGVVTIKPTSSLPTITDQVTINGYSQYGASPNTLAKGTNAKIMVELDGEDVGNSTIDAGLTVKAPGTVIRGLAINHFSDVGIYVVLDATDVKIEGNFIGTDPSGTTDTLTYQNGAAAVYLWNTNGTNVVGGATPAARNLISGNDGDGVYVASNGDEVLGNLIGTTKDGKSPLGNSGSGVVVNGSDTIVGRAGPGYANTIAFNGDDGVRVGPFYNIRSSIISNLIFSNGGLGIDLEGGTESASGATANDLGDADTGPNDLQNKPVLSSVKKSSTGKTVIKGKLNSTPNKTYTIQFFKNPKGNEGKTLLFSKSVSTDGSGNASFTFSTKKAVALGSTITATATNNSTGDTSEFSAPRKVVRP